MKNMTTESGLEAIQAMPQIVCLPTMVSSSLQLIGTMTWLQSAAPVPQRMEAGGGSTGIHEIRRKIVQWN